MGMGEKQELVPWKKVFGSNVRGRHRLKARRELPGAVEGARWGVHKTKKFLSKEGEATKIAPLRHLGRGKGQEGGNVAVGGKGGGG